MVLTWYGGEGFSNGRFGTPIGRSALSCQFDNEGRFVNLVVGSSKCVFG
jgi:hypothetical protein